MIFLIIAGTVLLMFGLVVIRGAPYVPSHMYEVKQAFNKLYKLGDTDLLVDVGSGDGLILRHAASYDARAVGYEINPILVAISRLLAVGNPLVTTKLADFWYKDLPADTTIVYAFCVSRDSHKLAKKMQHETNRLGRPLTLMTYGAPLKNKKATKKHRGHHLYTFAPLQDTEA